MNQGSGNGGQALSTETMGTEPAERALLGDWRSLLSTVRAKYPKATDNEFALFIYQANRLNLDPIAGQIHLVPRFDNYKKCYVSSVQTGIDGYRAVSDRSKNYAGSDDPTFDEGLTQSPAPPARNRVSCAIYGFSRLHRS